MVETQFAFRYCIIIITCIIFSKEPYTYLAKKSVHCYEKDQPKQLLQSESLLKILNFIIAAEIYNRIGI